VALVVLAAAASMGTAATARTSLRPGHAVTVYEKNVNLDVAGRLADYLRAHGVDVVLTRDQDTTVSLAKRAAIANQAGSDLFVSLHNNASPYRYTGGTEVYYQQQSAAGADIAASILKGVAARTGLAPRGAFIRPGADGDYYYVLRTIHTPAVLVEGAFISNRNEARQLDSASFREQLAEGIANGILGRSSGAGPGPPEIPTAGTLESPGALVAEPTGHGRVTLRWNAAPGATRYGVWRDDHLIADLGPSDIGLSSLLSILRLPVTYVDTAAPGGTHVYQVQAINDAAASRSTPTSMAVTLPLQVVIDPGHGGDDPGAIGSY
jgi:N-acetylmuramoyl-L-alanine amidase